MDPILYKSAVSGKFDEVLKQNKDNLHTLRTPNNNTLLHLFPQFNDSADCVNQTLDGLSSPLKRSMLLAKNSRGETALHIAARRGRLEIVRALIGCAKALHEEEGVERGDKIVEEMMRATDEKEGDTALHNAVRNKHGEVVKVLVEEDSEFTHSLNKMEETPLYVAVERDLCEVMKTILKFCKSPSCKGPGGKSPLHAAVIQNCSACVEELLQHNQALTREVDEHGWTPLHIAARTNHAVIARQLIQVDRTATYITTTKGDSMSPLHLAAWRGNHVEVMKEILENCPDCWEMTTSKYQNILHLAVDYENKQVIEFILSNSWAANLINEKDDEGNTPLHLYANSYNLDVEALAKYKGADISALNRKNLTPLDIIGTIQHYNYNEKSIKAQLKKEGRWGYRNLVQEDYETYMKRKDAIASDERNMDLDIRKKGDVLLIIATLIATVTFAAGFTLPGGYDGNDGPNQGMAVLVRKATFKTFVVADTIAVISSVLAVILQFISSMYRVQDKIVNRFVSSMFLTLVSAIAMMVAFMTGLYTVLVPSSLGMAITLCFFSSSCILIIFWLVYRLFDDN